MELTTMLYEHNRWANLMLADLALDLKPEQLDAPGTEGTYGSTRATLFHIAWNEESYIRAATGDESQPPPPDELPPLPEIRERLAISGGRLIELMHTLDMDAELTGRFGPQRYRMTPAVPLAQAINHGTEHRAHILSNLTHLGIEPPVIDIWRYAIESGHLEWA